MGSIPLIFCYVGTKVIVCILSLLLYWWMLLSVASASLGIISKQIIVWSYWLFEKNITAIHFFNHFILVFFISKQPKLAFQIIYFQYNVNTNDLHYTDILNWILLKNFTFYCKCLLKSQDFSLKNFTRVIPKVIWLY